MVGTLPALCHPVEHADGELTPPVGARARPERVGRQGGRSGTVGRANTTRGDGAIQGHPGRPGRVCLPEGDRALQTRYVVVGCQSESSVNTRVIV